MIAREEMWTMPSGESTQIDPKTCEVCSLDCVRAGEHLEIIAVDDDHARIQALRFGMSAGACVQCVTRIPAGPLVIQSGRQEIAVGRALAKRIRVRRRDQHAARN
jgi:Fe2+ transport system protein FeoA